MQYLHNVSRLIFGGDFACNTHTTTPNCVLNNMLLYNSLVLFTESTVENILN